MSQLVIIVIVIWVFYKIYKLFFKDNSGQEARSSNAAPYAGTSRPVSNPKLEIPSDTLGAVGTFAGLCNQVREFLKKIDGLRDDYFSVARITLEHIQGSERMKAEFSFDFDYSLNGVIKSLGYELGDGLKVDGDIITFVSDQITDLESYLKQDGGNNDITAKYIANIFIRVCPDAYVNFAKGSNEGYFIVLKFR